MTEDIYTIHPEAEAHQGGVRALLAKSFGPLRMGRAIYQLRQGTPPDPELCFVMLNKHDLVLGIVRNYRVKIGDSPLPALLLGPIATAHSHEKMGLAARLINHVIARARELGYVIIYLVGDPNYYRQFGFTEAKGKNVFIEDLEHGKIIMGLELQPGVSKKMKGEMKADDKILLRQLRQLRQRR